jgi:ribosomal protein S18 acetylase RimI-like enzyme
MHVEVSSAVTTDVPELVDVAARTFPLACPLRVTPHDIAAFISENLSQRRFTDYLADPERLVLVARADNRILGYAMMIRGVADDPDVARAVPQRPAVELSKMYVAPDHHGAGVSPALMAGALDSAIELGAVCVWLGVNQENQRAQRFYAKHGFAVAGTKTFRLGGHVENDYVMVRALYADAACVNASSRDVARRYFFRNPPASISSPKMASTFAPDAITGIPASYKRSVSETSRKATLWSSRGCTPVTNTSLIPSISA